MSKCMTLCFDAALLSLALIFGVGSTFAATLRPPSPDAGAPVLVIAPPWGPGAVALVNGAGGQVVGPVSAPMGALAVFSGAPPVDRLSALGAWGVHDPGPLAALCGAVA